MSTGSGSGEAPGADDDPPPDGRAPAPRGGDGTFADVLDGFAAASGPGRRKRTKSKPPHEAEGTPAAEGQPPPQPTDQGDQVTSVASPPGSSDAIPPGVLFDPGPFPGFPEPQVPGEETAVVRPYALTGGRTRSTRALELETLISAREDATEAFVAAGGVEFESLSILEECQTPRSVAEIAAALRVPLGVARVLISDAADTGLVTVHRTISGRDGAEAHLVLMERVLSGLRRL
jgi:hypothetical protein